MKNNRFAGFSCIAILLCRALAPGAGRGRRSRQHRAAAKAQPPLWAQAVKIFEANKDLVPGKVLPEDSGARGRRPREVGIERRDLPRARRRGKDKERRRQGVEGRQGRHRRGKKKAEERSKKEAAKEQKKKKDAEKNAKKASKSDSDKDSKESSHSISTGDSPFDPEVQNDVRITETNARETIGGRSCVRFGYTYPARTEKPSKGKPAMVKGTAWIEEGTGNPVKVEFTNDPLPKGAKSMLTTLHYGNGENGSWILERMEFEASGSFLFIKKRIRGDIALGDYWKYVESDSQKQ